MPTEFTTLEDARAEIIRLNEVLTEVQNERDTLSQNNETLTEDNERLRTLNQNYFNKLSAQYSDPEGKNDDEDEEPLSCEEFAKTINI